MPLMKQRFFILQEKKLFYFANKQNPPLYADEPLGAIDLATSDAHVTVHAQDAETLMIVSAGRTWELKFATALEAAAWLHKLSAAQQGNFLYDGDSVNVPAAAAAVDPRTGVDFRVLPAGQAPQSAAQHAPEPAAVAQVTIKPGLQYPDSDDEEIKQRKEFGGRYTEWVGSHAFDDGLEGVPSRIVSALPASSPSLLDSAPAPLPADVVVESESESDDIVVTEQDLQAVVHAPSQQAPPPPDVVVPAMPAVPTQTPSYDPAPAYPGQLGAAPVMFPTTQYVGVAPGPYQVPNYFPSWGQMNPQAGWMG